VKHKIAQIYYKHENQGTDVKFIKRPSRNDNDLYDTRDVRKNFYMNHFLWTTLFEGVCSFFSAIFLKL